MTFKNKIKIIYITKTNQKIKNYRNYEKCQIIVIKRIYIIMLINAQ